MTNFMTEDFLLSTGTAKELYHNFAEKLPVIDYHCHIIPQEIAQDRRFDNITQVWLGGDHYKWRLMRAAGVSEEYITGGADDYDKFCKYAGAISKAVGNPLYHWSHLELKRYFGWSGVLSEKTASEVWNLCNEKLKSPEMSAKNLIKSSNVELICTTDDPADTLQWHKEIAEDKNFTAKVYPTWRPDKAMNIEKEEFTDYIGKLAALTEMRIESFTELKAALKKRMGYFAAHGCIISDHGIDYVDYVNLSDTDIESIFKKRMNGHTLTDNEIRTYKSAFMQFSGEQYSELGWTMQLHFNCKRNNNSRMFGKIGADTGYDCISNYAPAEYIADFLNSLDVKNKLPKTILYSLNPTDNQVLDTIAGCFQGNETNIVNKIQHGSAWWFNDHKDGMKDQLKSLAANGYLAGFIGMLTDSRSFLSYTRHEYFRRILCSVIGKWVENGEFPQDMELLGDIVSDISYNNAKRYLQV